MTVTTYEKLGFLEERFGAPALLDEIFDWFPTSQMDECLEDIADLWDIDLKGGRS